MKPQHHVDTSISLGVLPQLTIDRSLQIETYEAVQIAAPSAGTTATFRQVFRPWLGYSVNLGYMRMPMHYVEPSTFPVNNNFNVNSNAWESTVSYVAQTTASPRWSLFGDVGGGVLTFQPTTFEHPYVAYQHPGVQARPAGVGGAGMELHFARSWAFRMEYRGLLYEGPDYNTGAESTYHKQMTLTSEPTLSLVYHFGGNRH